MGSGQLILSLLETSAKQQDHNGAKTAVVRNPAFAEIKTHVAGLKTLKDAEAALDVVDDVEASSQQVWCAPFRRSMLHPTTPFSTLPLHAHCCSLITPAPSTRRRAGHASQQIQDGGAIHCEWDRAARCGRLRRQPGFCGGECGSCFIGADMLALAPDSAPQNIFLADWCS